MTEEKIDQLAAIKFLYLLERKNHKQIAEIIGVCPHTVGRIVKKHKLKAEMNNRSKKAANDPLRHARLLSSAIVYCRIHMPEYYPLILLIQEHFLNHCKKHI